MALAIRACRAEGCLVRNHILSRLARPDFSLLEPHLETVDLPVRRRLPTRNKHIEHVYFPESGIASVVTKGEYEIAIGMIGREGMTGASVMFGEEGPVEYETLVQIAGEAHRLSADHLREALGKSTSLHAALLQYGYQFLAQIAQTAVSNAHNKIEERLARWLLMANDRLDGDEVPLTHEFLSVMLGVRRPGVTTALDLLEKEGLVQAKRRAVLIIDRKGLRKITNGAYGAPEAEFKRLFG
jgi:CRP-like cAMP-binding protein